MRKRNLIALLPAAAMLTLAGCGGDSAVISDLKEKTFPVGSSLTYEQALDRRAVCASTSWEVIEDSRGREVVRYECGFAGISGGCRSVHHRRSNATVQKPAPRRFR